MSVGGYVNINKGQHTVSALNKINKNNTNMQDINPRLILKAGPGIGGLGICRGRASGISAVR